MEALIEKIRNTLNQVAESRPGIIISMIASYDFAMHIMTIEWVSKRNLQESDLILLHGMLKGDPLFLTCSVDMQRQEAHYQLRKNDLDMGLVCEEISGEYPLYKPMHNGVRKEESTTSLHFPTDEN